MLQRTVAACAGAATVIAIAASPASGLTEPVTITVVIHPAGAPLDSPSKTFRATGVTVGDGPEVTEDHLVVDSEGACGAVEVDIDPDARSIAVTATDPGCAVVSVSVGIRSAELWNLGVEPASNELVTWQPAAGGQFQYTGGAFATDEPVISASWYAFEAGQTMTLAGRSVFTYPLSGDHSPVPPALPGMDFDDDSRHDTTPSRATAGSVLRVPRFEPDTWYYVRHKVASRPRDPMPTVDLGWVKTDASGTAAVQLPAILAPDEYFLFFTRDRRPGLDGWAQVTVVAAQQPAPSAPAPAAPARPVTAQPTFTG